MSAFTNTHEGQRSRALLQSRLDLIAISIALGFALALGISTAKDYGLTIDEFNVDDYGPKALAWYTSAFTDRSQFETVEPWLWAYGPWFQILVTIVQSLNFADPITVRHAITFLIGLAGVAALLPIARLTFSGWAGVVAIILCLTTGYFYGHLFFTPIDVPFMAAMTWATLAIVMGASREIPTWGLTLAVGLATGLAMATRTAGIVTHAYLVGAMALAVLDVWLRHSRERRAIISAIAVRTLAAVIVAWIFAVLIWPWLQIGNPFTQFAAAHKHFWTLENVFTFPSWGQSFMTNALPWHYIPGQLLARLPEGFLLLLLIAAGSGLAAIFKFGRQLIEGSRAGLLREPLLLLARSRGTLVIVMAALVPPIVVIMRGSTLYDGVRHLLFIIPMLALLAGDAFVKLIAFLRTSPIATAVLSFAIVANLAWVVTKLAHLHPLEYVAMNALPGGNQGAYRRFELDYWSAAATEAVRRLEQRLDHQATPPNATSLARVLVCIPWPTPKAYLLFRRQWLVEIDPTKADFIIASERSRCGEGKEFELIDRVERLGRPFAQTYANRNTHFGRSLALSQ